MTWSNRLGAVGVWRGVNDLDPAMAEAIEELGFGTIWQGGSPGSDLRAAEDLLDATESLQLATGIVNIWKSDPAELADSYHRVEARYPGRLLLGIGSGHREATPERVRPLDAMAGYLDVLDEHGVPQEARALSALGPRMLELAAARSAGTHPYLTVPSQSGEARRILGPDALVAPEQTVVFDADPDSARRTARKFLRRYLNWRITGPRCCGAGSAKLTWLGRAATTWWTDWSPMATRRSWPPRFGRTLIPALTMCACRSSQFRATSFRRCGRSRAKLGWHPHLDDRRAAADTAWYVGGHALRSGLPDGRISRAAGLDRGGRSLGAAAR